MFRSLAAFDDNSLDQAGYAKVALSLFDHWLTEAEFADCRRLSFDMAVQSGLRAEYMKEEERFLDFYRTAFAAGVYCAAGPAMTWFPAWNDDLRGVVVASLREWRLMDVYCPSLRLRAMGGYDRTDLLLLERFAPRDNILRLIEDSGLFAL
jgi:hypothetical protein